MRFVKDEQGHQRQVDDPVHGIVSDDLRRRHHDRGTLPQRLSFVRAGITGVGHNLFLIEIEALLRHGHLLVDQSGGWGDENDLSSALSEKFRHGHPFNGCFSESCWHHHQTGKREDAFERTQLIASCFNAILEKGMNDVRHGRKVMSRVQKDDVGSPRIS